MLFLNQYPIRSLKIILNIQKKLGAWKMDLQTLTYANTSSFIPPTYLRFRLLVCQKRSQTVRLLNLENDAT